MIVMKFGGTSVKDAEAIERACRIVRSRIDRAPLVVASALSGVTSGLLEAARLAAEEVPNAWLETFERLRQQHLELLPGLDSDLSGLRQILEEVSAARHLSPEMEDRIASHGEILSSQIVADRLKALAPTTHVDARKCLVTDDNFGAAMPMLEETSRALNAVVRDRIRPGHAVVVGGYVGSTVSGSTSTLGRGGSDYSATLFAACLDADEVEIWTDVDGMMTADPRVVADAWTIRAISFAEASELAYFGAKVLHPSTLLPAVQRGIPVRVLNSLKPDRPGTVITAAVPIGDTPVKSFAAKRGITAITVSSSRMFLAYGFLRALFEIFEKHTASVDLVTTSEVSVSLTMDNVRKLDAIVSDLKSLGKVEIEHGLALVCVVGANLKDRPGIAAQVFGCLTDVNVRMISQGASEINVSFVVREEHADRALRSLHSHFFREPDPEVFERET